MSSPEIATLRVVVENYLLDSFPELDDVQVEV
jgi:hypothetical protein